MEKLKFFKGLFFGLIMSVLMWVGILWTIMQVGNTQFQPEISKVKKPVAVNYFKANVSP